MHIPSIIILACKAALIATALALLSVSCSKPRGCIDPNASNYLYEAKKDDGSCKYDMSFWMNSGLHGSMNIYVDNVIWGQLSCYYASTRPTCGNDTLVRPGYTCVINVPLYPGPHFVRVEAADGTIWEDTLTLGENCLSVLISY